MREFDLLQHVYESNPHLGARIELPPGDDLAMVRLEGRQVLAGVDQLVAGRHVNLETTPLELVGRKAVCRSLSDIAAMAARPVATLAAVTLPPDFGEDRATALFDAMRRTADEFACPLIGGDIAFHGHRSHPLICSVTVLAEPGSAPPITRSGALPGNRLYVTGRLGGAVQPDGSGRHLTFQPRIREALALAEKLGSRLHAMIDISDGLGRDAGHLAVQSNVQIRLDAAAIPCSTGVDWRAAVAGGEDYELCFAASGDVPGEVNGVPVTVVGEVLEPPAAGAAGPDAARVVIIDGDTRIDASEMGWQHEA